MSEPIGTCCGIDEAIKYLAEAQPRHKGDEMPYRIINRLKYIRAKEVGVKPKLNKGKYCKDWYTCGHCGAGMKDSVNDNFCWNCGYRILWDSTRCLTGREKK